MSELLRFADADVEILTRLKPGSKASVRLDGADHELNNVLRDGDTLSFEHDGHRYRFAVAVTSQDVSVDGGQGVVRVQRIEPGADPAAAGNDSLLSKMPGKVLQLLVAPGTSVTAGTPLLILEAMKMEHQVAAPADGVLVSYPVAEGQRVMPGDLLAEFEVA